MTREGFDPAAAAARGRGEGELTSPHGFVEMLEARQRSANTLLCVGLDPDLGKIPASLIEEARTRFPQEDPANLTGSILAEFNRRIIDATHEFVSAYKPNIAFYESHGEQGLAALRATIKHIREVDPTIPIILDAKRGDIGKTNQEYADMVKGFGVDAVTVNPLFGIKGKGALDPFLMSGVGVIILCRTSNSEAGDILDENLQSTGEPLYIKIAHMAEEARQDYPNVAIVVGATFPEQLRRAREVFRGPILVPGLGSQGGKPEDLVGAFNNEGLGIIANNASKIIHASEGEDFAEAAGAAAMDWRDRINAARELPRPEGPTREEKLAARQERTLQILKDTGAFKEGHFLLKSGRHSDKYVNKDAIYPYIRETEEIGQMMAEDFKDLGVDVVVGPAVGGIPLSRAVTASLERMEGRRIPAVYAEKSRNEETGEPIFVFNRGYAERINGKKVLITEDILTTGASVVEVIDAVRKAGGAVVGVSGIVNRGGVTAESLGVPVLSTLANLDIPSWNPGKENCYLCKEDVPIDNLGHGTQQKMTHP